ncbi:MAG: PaaX family transcriptional regulator C-terminal domain-containing protein [Polyangiaceae bacterium]|jgi:phenylacetic acid degradation operon negative regulatory protein
MAPTAKSVILELLVAMRGAPLSARAAIVACALFEISENSTRVALVRLSSAGRIDAVGRGAYRLSDASEDLAREVAGWRSAEGRLRRWGGGYVAVHAGSLGRTDRAELRRRERALQMLGLREFDRGLYLRPDNLAGGVEAVRSRLYALGLEREAMIFHASSLSVDVEGRVQGLWDGEALTAAYGRSRAEIERWLKLSARLEPNVAAREAFLLGGRAIRQIVYDPLLPAPLVDEGERRAFFAAAKQIDDAGREVWRRFFEFYDAGNPSEDRLESRVH